MEIQGRASGHLSHAEHRGTERREFLFSMDQGAWAAVDPDIASVERCTMAADGELSGLPVQDAF